MSNLGKDCTKHFECINIIIFSGAFVVVNTVSVEIINFTSNEWRGKYYNKKW
jgi:hypothetical protein